MDEDAPALLQFDFVDMDEPISQELRETVLREGIVFMKKFDNYVSQLSVLRRAKDEDLDNEFVMSDVANKFALQVAGF